jgi:hypothetical protein
VLPNASENVRMNFKLSVKEASQWKMFTNLEDYKNRMVTMRTGWHHIEGYQIRMVYQRKKSY